MKNEKLNYYKHIVDKSLDIIDAMGTEQYSYVDFNEVYLGKQYNFDKLRIVLDEGNKKKTNNKLSIYIDDICVFSFRFNSSNVNIIEGKWIDIIDYIHDLIPEFLEKKEIDRKNKINRERNVALLISSINEFLDYYNSQAESRKYISMQLLLHGIKIKKNSYNKTIKNKQTGEKEKESYNTYSLLVNNHEVIEFKSNGSIQVEDFIEYQDKFVPGEWINTFIDCVEDTTDYIDEIQYQKVDNISEEIIRKLRK